MPEWECIECGVKATSKCPCYRSVFPVYSENVIENNILKSMASCIEKKVERKNGVGKFHLKIDLEYVDDIFEGSDNGQISAQKFNHYYELLQLISEKKLLKKMSCKHWFDLIDEEECDLGHTWHQTKKKTKVEKIMDPENNNDK